MKTLLKNAMSRKLVTLPTGTSLSQAEELMLEKRIRHLPIVNKNSEIIGMLCDHQLVTRGDPFSIPVDYVMSQDFEYLHQDSPLRLSALKMLEKKISAVLICNDDQEAVGIITTDDLVWHLASLLERETNHVTLSSIFNIGTLNRAADQISNAGI